MTYAPNIFSTKAGLTRTIIFQWVGANDQATIEQWLTQGEKHPRLAQEAIEEAISECRMDIAERVWQANWHAPAKTYEAVWNRLWFAAGVIDRLEDPTYRSRMVRNGEHVEEVEVLRTRHQAAVEWALSKSLEAPTGAPARQANLGLVFALRYAFNRSDETLWDRIVAHKPNLDVSEGNELLQYMAHRMPLWPNPFSHERAEVAPWINEHALSDMFACGLKPGGSVWVGAASHLCAQPLLDLLVEYAPKITKPRQRTAILVYAAEQKAFNVDTLISALVPLGSPEKISLTPSENKRKEYSEATYLGDRGSDHSFINIRNPYDVRSLQKESVSLAAAFGSEKWSKVRREFFTQIAADAAPASRPAVKPSKL